MAVGDINITSFTVGGLDLSNSKDVHLVGFNLYEDMMNPFGPILEARVVDPSDKLGQQNIKGGEEVNISFSTGSGGQSRSMKLKLVENRDLDDGSISKSGSGKMKQYNLKAVSNELVSAQAKRIQKTYNDKPIGDVVKDIHENILESDLDIEVEQTKKQRIQFDRDHLIDAMNKIYNRGVSTQNKSSLFAYYQAGDSGDQKYRFETFEKAFDRDLGLSFTQDATLAAKAPDQESAGKNLIWFKPSNMFNRLPRPLTTASETTYNRETGVAHRVKQEPQKQFKVAGQKVFNSYGNSDQNNADERPAVYHLNSPSNHKSQHGIGEAKANRAAYLAHLGQNWAEFEVPGNSELTVGGTIDLDIPNKSTGGTSGGEKQFNGKALVVAVRHKVKPLGQTPRYTCVVRVIKAAYKQGGGGEG